jgi:hypothetical protein
MQTERRKLRDRREEAIFSVFTVAVGREVEPFPTIAK